jgi:hypothetical protein
MNDLEALLRNEFDEQARSVPDSVEPLLALQRRLARRRALLVSAAAATLVVVAAIVVPLARQAAPVTPATAPNPTLTTIPSTPGIPTRQHPLLFAEASGNKAWVYVSGDRVVCVAVTHGNAAIDPNKEDCEPDLVEDAGGHRPVRTRAVGAQDGPFGHFLLFVVDQGVHDLSVQDGDGTAVPLRLLGATRERQFWLADFGGSPQGFGYSGIDVDGEHFSAIT